MEVAGHANVCNLNKRRKTHTFPKSLKVAPPTQVGCLTLRQSYVPTTSNKVTNHATLSPGRHLS